MQTNTTAASPTDELDPAELKSAFHHFNRTHSRSQMVCLVTFFDKEQVITTYETATQILASFHTCEQVKPFYLRSDKQRSIIKVEALNYEQARTYYLAIQFNNTYYSIDAALLKHGIHDVPVKLQLPNMGTVRADYDDDLVF